MAFSDEDKERVRSATNIADLIAEHTTVKRSGRNHMAVCVFHQEKTPSMSIDVARGLYHCHGCHASGDMFTFVQETQGLTFPEALEFLARRAGITLTEDPEARRRAGKRAALVEAVGRAIEYYHRLLMGDPGAGNARAYLRGRGYGAETVSDFKLGYAPGGDRSDHLARELRAQGIADGVMVDAGLARRGRGGGLYDYFRDRLMFPTYDLRGDPVGFGGRILGEGQPKYLNSPETAIYKKSRLLYGLDRARREIQRAGYAVVVEGYTDVIALHRYGIPLAVATNGTALGDDHFDLLRRFCDRVVLAFDADAAGGRAARRGEDLEIPVRLDLDLRVAVMPPGVDPADMVARGDGEKLVDAIERSRPLLQFSIEQELGEHDLSEPESRARALRSIAPRVARVADDIARTEYARFLADRMGVDIDVVLTAIGRPRRRPRADRETVPSRAATGIRQRLERQLLRSVLADGGAAREAGVDAGSFSDEEAAAAFRAIESLVERTPMGSPVPLNGMEEGLPELVVVLAMDAAPAEPVAAVLDRLMAQRLEEEISERAARLDRMAPEDDRYSETFAELLRLQEEKRRRESS